FPLRAVAGIAGASGERDRPVQRDPAPQLAVGVTLALALEFPDPIVRLAAQLPDAVSEALDDHPQFRRDEAALALVNRHAVDHGAEHVQLALAGGTVPDPHRTGAVETGQVFQEFLRQTRIAIDAIDDLHREVVVVGAVASLLLGNFCPRAKYRSPNPSVNHSCLPGCSVKR